MSFLSFTVDGIVYQCNKKGYPIFPFRKSPRKFSGSESLTEREFIQQINAENINLHETEAYKWFKRKLGKPVCQDMSALGRLISRISKLEFPREAYRRTSTTIYWFHTNWTQIKVFLNKHKVYGFHSTKGLITFDAPLVLPKIFYIIP